MNKKYFLFAGFLVWAVTALVWMNQGCSLPTPPMGAIAPTSTPVLPNNIVSDFEDGKSDVNPTLSGVLDPVWNAATPSHGLADIDGTSATGQGAWTVNTFGGIPANTVNGGLSPSTCNDPANPCFILAIPPSPPALAGNTSRFAAHIFGPLYITGGKYESHQLVCKLRNSPDHPYFDATGFLGVRFDIYIGSSDTNTVPVFQVGIDKTTPPSSGVGGTCLGTGCYNHYTCDIYDLSESPDPTMTPGPAPNSFTRVPLNPAFPCGTTPPCRDRWMRITVPWTAMSQRFGLPAGSLSSNLTKLLLLQFQFNNNAAAASNNYTEFWVDNVEFF